MSQSVWKFLANLGDVGWLDYGGYFIFKDETGVYTEEAELLVVDNEWETDDDKLTYTIYRFSLDRCTYINDVLSDNKFHPDHAAWWAKPESERKERPQDNTYLKNIADHDGKTVDELVTMFCSENPLERAMAYRAVGEYHGFENLDSYPLTTKGENMTREEIKKRYKECK